jgi:DNA-binding transcriptional MocR family regulator
LSKVLGPDLRIALLAGDPLTVRQVEGRQLLGAGWVSHLLQQTAAELWGNAETSALLARAREAYSRRRGALVDALGRRGFAAYGSTGLGVWVPVAEEAVVVQRLLERGWAVSAGERFRHRSPAGIRITTTDLAPAEAEQLAAALDEVTRVVLTTYAG